MLAEIASYVYSGWLHSLAYGLISLYQPITTNYMIMNIIDLERPPIVCIEVAVHNGGQALRSIVRVRK